MGIILMLLASASFATMAAMIKAIGPDLPLSQLVFLRCFLAAPVLAIFLIKQDLPLVVQARRLLLGRTILGIMAMHCFFYALTHMELAGCVFIGRIQPLLLALMAPFLIKEHVPKAAWLAIIAGLIGIALIMNPSAQWSLAALVAFGGAFFSALVHLLIRRMNRTDHPQVIVFNFTVLTGLVTGLWSIPAFVPLSAKEWLLISGVALFASIGQILMTSAYRFDRAPAVAAASYSSVVLSVVYGYLFWGENPAPIAWLGGGLIVIGGALLVRSRHNILEPAAVFKTNSLQEVSP